MKTELQPMRSHRKSRMKKLFPWVLIVLLALLVLSNLSAISAATARGADKLLLYVRVARLYSREPDRRLSMPVQNVSKKEIANTWQAPRGADRRHQGQDIFAPRGTPVLSATEGYVMNIGENPLGGQTISVVGAGGRSYYYAHLDSYASRLAEGDHVTRETVLGYVGTTGNAQGTPPHLHFGVYATSGALDPLPLLTDRSRNGKLNRDRGPGVADKSKTKRQPRR